jgi:hypothetical protein
VKKAKRDLNEDLEIGYEEVRVRGELSLSLDLAERPLLREDYGYGEILKHGFGLKTWGRNIAKLYG